MKIMPQCFVTTCRNYYGKTRATSKVVYHMFPSSPTLALKWSELCGHEKNVKPPTYSRVCSEHFSPSSYQRDLQHELLGLPLRKKLKCHAVPNQKLPKTKPPSRSSMRIAERLSLKDYTKTTSKLEFLLKLNLNKKIKQIEKINIRNYEIEFCRKSKQEMSCLNKMHVMEDVREGSDVPGAQPSSPGHAEQRPNIQEIPQASNENDEAPSQTNGDSKSTTDESKSEDKPEPKEKDELEIASIPEDASNDSTNEESAKRKCESEEESTSKRLRSTIDQNFALREKIFGEYVDNAGCTTVTQIQVQMDQILSEIRTLNDLAREKEKEWNNIIHLKKMKEELLLRVQRRKQILMLSNDKIDWNDVDSPESQIDLDKNSKNSFSLIYSSPGGTKSSESSSKQKSRNLPSTVIEINGHSGDLRQNKQRPVLDVQSIIADYRQRHPEAVPRRGRRIRSILNNQGDSSMVRSGNGSVMSFSSISLGSGSQVKQNLNASSVEANTELGLLLTAVDNSKSSGTKSGNDALESASFKDVLMQFAKLSQTERQDLLQTAMKPPPYSEVTVHPVPAHTQTTSNSLLHGILTKTQSKSENNNKSTFSPTLARLLTAPERAAISPHNNHNTPVSISDMLSNNKARNEITITPVGGGQFDLTVKDKQGDEEEAEDSADRLVIDESEALDGRKCADNGSDAGDEVPQCQGCNQKPAQFVCAGCGNQWYCSRECQVVAWDEHSDVCSG